MVPQRSTKMTERDYLEKELQRLARSIDKTKTKLADYENVYQILINRLKGLTK